ncbi:MAG: hypothetical protein WAT09_05115 [Paracoccaceae bacterium]
MVWRTATLGLVIGLAAGFCGPDPAMAEVAINGATLDVPGEMAQAAAVAPICQRNARADAFSAETVFDLYAQQIGLRIYARLVERWSTPVDGIIEDVTEGMLGGADAAAQIVAEDSAALPNSARDLPLLVILASYETSDNPIMRLMLSPDFVLVPDILAMLERQGMTDTLHAFRMAQAAIPDWVETSEDWARVYAADEQTELAIAKAGLQAASRIYPAGRARQMGVALIAGDPQVAKMIIARMASEDEDIAMDWLLQQLTRQCYRDFETAADADRVYAAMGTPQAALLLLDSLLLELSDEAIEYYFTGPPGIMAPATARVMEIRGMSAEAEAIRTGMALFPAPFPRESLAREDAIHAFTDDQTAQLTALGPVFDEDRIWSEMKLIAREAGLLPGAAP